MSRSYTLVIDCPDRPGIVYGVSKIIFENSGNILESRQFEDRETGRFFLRVVFESGCDHDVLADAVARLGEEFKMDWKLVPTAQPVKVLILVSKFDHCLAHLLYKVRRGQRRRTGRPGPLHANSVR
jgi:formyltetrahydrofolate deformylase